MKFTAAVVVLALVAVAANASPLWGGPVVSVDVSSHGLLGHGLGPWGHGVGVGHGLIAGHGLGLGHGLVAGHGLALGHPGVIAGHGLIGHGLIGHAGPTLVQGIGAHGLIGAHAAHGVHGVHGHEASYVAANRGSVHVAPLVGHIQSASSINTAPAPGTTW